MHTIAEEHNIIKFQKILQGTVKKFKSFFKIPVAYLLAHWLLILNRKAIKDIHKSIRECGQEDCEHCLSYAYEKANNIRTLLAQLLDIIPNNFFCFHLRYFTEKFLYDWDDIAEDAYIGQDKEIKVLVGQLSERL